MPGYCLYVLLGPHLSFVQTTFIQICKCRLENSPAVRLRALPWPPPRQGRPLRTGAPHAAGPAGGEPDSPRWDQHAAPSCGSSSRTPNPLVRRPSGPSRPAPVTEARWGPSAFLLRAARKPDQAAAASPHFPLQGPAPASAEESGRRAEAPPPPPSSSARDARRLRGCAAP